MNLNIRYLEYILEIYRCGSINKAAQKCFISQPHLSKILKDVEQELGFDIIQRDRSGLTFNRNGLYFIDSVEKILQEAQKIERALNTYVHPKYMEELDRINRQFLSIKEA